MKIPFLPRHPLSPLDPSFGETLSRPARPELTGGRSIGVLLVHGFTGSPASMRPWGAYLADLGYAVEVPRLPGHGTTWQEANGTGWRDWYAEAERSFDALRVANDAVVVAGLSMGGCLALRLAEHKGDAMAGVVVVNPFLSSRDPRARVLSLVRLLTSSITAQTNDIKKPGQDEGAYPRIPVHALASINEMWKDVVPQLGTITQPVLHFHSSVDHTIDDSSRDTLAQGLRTADYTQRVLEDSYHVATLDNDAETIFSESAEFIARVSAVRSSAGPSAG